jgi:EpsI family protein
VIGADRDLYRFYSGWERPLGVYVGVYGSQRPGAELVSTGNEMVAEHDPRWSEKGRATRILPLPQGSLEVSQHELGRRSGERLLVWSWYQIGDWQGSNPYLAKVVEVWRRIFQGRSDGALIAVAAPFADAPQPAEEALRRFVGDMLPAIRASVEGALGEP